MLLEGHFDFEGILRESTGGTFLLRSFHLCTSRPSLLLVLHVCFAYPKQRTAPQELMSRNYKSSPLPAVEATTQDASAYSFVSNPNNTDRTDYGTAGGRDGSDGGLQHRAHRSAPLPSMAIEEEKETFTSAIFQW